MRSLTQNKLKQQHTQSMKHKSILNPNLPGYPKGFKKYWTIHNKRYDMSLFLDKHPGGRRMILQGQGRNCTELFESYHSLSTLNMAALLDRFYVEDTPVGAPDWDESYDWDPKTPAGKFWETLKERVRTELGKKGTHKASPTQLVTFLAICAVTLAILPFFFKGYWFSIILLPILYYVSGNRTPSRAQFIGCSAMHDGGHCNMSKYEWVNNLAAAYGSAVCSPLWWQIRHNVGHHEHRKRTVLYMLPTLATFYISYLVEITYRVINPRNEFIELGTFSLADKVFHHLSRVAFFSLFVVYPFLTFPTFKAIAFAAIPYLIHGGIFYTLSQISHFNDQCFHEHERLTPDSPSKKVVLDPMSKHWAVHQIQHSMDWGIPAPFTVILSIGLCFQTVHHLFPQVYHMNLSSIQPVVEQTSKEFGVTYNWVPTLDELIELYGKMLGRYGLGSIAVTWVRNQGPIIHCLKWVGQKLGQTHPKGWKY